jgi:hypothetical protein
VVLLVAEPFVLFHSTLSPVPLLVLPVLCWCAACVPAGACSDSHYEYLLKQWLLTGKTEDWLRQRYIRAMQSVRAR